MPVNKELSKLSGNHNETGTVLEIPMMSAHGMLHGVLSHKAGKLHGNPCHGAAVGNMLPGLNVAAVSYCLWKILVNIRNGG